MIWFRNVSAGSWSFGPPCMQTLCDCENTASAERSDESRLRFKLSTSVSVLQNLEIAWLKIFRKFQTKNCELSLTEMRRNHWHWDWHWLAQSLLRCGRLRTSRTMTDNEQRYRLVVLGSGRVGKSSIIRRLLKDEFAETYKATVEDLHCRDYDIDGTTIRVDILDTAGNLEFRETSNSGITKKFDSRGGTVIDQTNRHSCSDTLTQFSVHCTPYLQDWLVDRGLTARITSPYLYLRTSKSQRPKTCWPRNGLLWNHE